jgi:putative SOS response-associated peptidase YedK
MADLHDRMPVVIRDDAWERWLHPTAAEPGELIAMLQPTDEILLRIYPVNRHVNDVRRDGPELIEPLAVAAAVPAEGTLGI